MTSSVNKAPTSGPQYKTIIQGTGGLGESASPSGSTQQSETGVDERSHGWIELLRLGNRYLRKFMGLVPRVLEDKDPDAAHKMRVASRRLEQVLLLIYSKPLPVYARKLRREAKRSRRMLGDLADCDVLLRIAERSLAHDPTRDAEAWKALARFLEQRRARIASRILPKLKKINFASSGARFERDLEDSGVRLRVHRNGRLQTLSPAKAEQIVRQRTLHSLAHLWREFESIVEESREDPCEKVIHGVRIKTKRLRNLVQVMKKLGTAGSPETLARLRDLQRAIGEWHDMEVLEHRTSKMLLHRKFVREHLELAVEIEQLFLRNREIKRAAEEEFRRMTVNSQDYQEIKNWVEGRLPGRAQAGRQAPVAPRPEVVPGAATVN